MLLKRMMRVLAFVLALAAGMLSGCASFPWSAPEATQIPIVTVGPTQEPARTLTVACIQEDGLELLADWSGIAKEQGFDMELRSMDLQSYWMLSADQRPAVVYFNGRDDLSNLMHLVEEGTVRRLSNKDLYGHQELRDLMQHYKPLYNDGYGYYALPRAAWDSTVGVPDGKVLYYRSDWIQSEKVDFSNITWDAFMEMMIYAASGDPDGNKIKDTKAIAVGEGLESWLLDLFGVRSWVLEDGQFVPGMVSSRARDALAWATQIRKENQLRVCESMGDALDSFVNGEVAMLLWDGNAEGVSQVEAAWSIVHETDGLLIQDCVSILPEPSTPSGTRYLPVTEAQDFIMIDSGVTPEELDRILCVADMSREASKSRLDRYEPESYAEGVRDDMSTTWWVNSWRGPVFADGVWSDEKVRLQNEIGEAVPGLLDELALVNSNFDESWTDWCAQIRSLESFEPACSAVNGQAEARRFFMEE